MTINALNIIPVKTDSCPTMGDYAIKKKMNVSWAKKKVGDIVLFDFNHNGTSDHIGLVGSINSNGTIDTIEGNTGSGNNTNGGQVQRRTRYKKDINYFVRPQYTKEVTAKMVIATAKAELGITEKPAGSNKVKYNRWFYGSNIGAFWCCTFICWLFAHVAEPEVIKTVAKPKGTYTGTIPTGLLKKGSTGQSVKDWQRFLKWYHPEWNLTIGGHFKEYTEECTKIFQKTEGLVGDGEAGKLTFAKARAYLAKKADTKKTAAKKTATPAKTTNQQKMISKMKELAWAYGTAKKQYEYKTGRPKDVCKKAMKKYGWADNKAEMSDCGNFASTVIRETGINTSFKALHGIKTAFPKSEKGFTLVLSGREIPSGFLKPADFIRYKKKNGKQHAMFYFGDGKVCEASHHSVFGVIRKDTKRYNTQSKHKTIQVFRVKE